MSRLAIFGAGGHGKVVADMAVSSGVWNEIVFFDDSRPLGFLVSGCWAVKGDFGVMLSSRCDFQGMIVAVGDNAVRLQLAIDIKNSGGQLVSLVHPRAYVSDLVEVGLGSVVMAGAVVHVGSQIGTACIINTAATIDHDCLISDGVHISPGVNLAGGVTIGRCSWVGIGASVIQQVFIGCETVVGAGSVVIENVPDGVVVVGCPAKKLAE